MTPAALKRPCSTPGCAGIATEHGKCLRHWQQVAHEYDKLRKHSDPHSTFTSGRRWREFRAAYLRFHPTCTVCGKRATQVHHPIPRRLGGDPYDEANCRALCLACHSRESVRSGERWGKR